MKRSTLKQVSIFFTVLFLFTLYLPLVSANNGYFSKLKPEPVNYAAQLQHGSTGERDDENLRERTEALYETMHLAQMGLSKSTFEYAMKGFDHLLQNGKFKNESIISIADLSLPSTEKRLFVIDLSQSKVLFNTYVAHGVNSGKVMAREFSNQPSSYKSSLGFYETLSTYMGGHGYSLKLEGLEKGINDNANRRAIVMHAAAYVNEALIKSQGFIGRSWGCPALPEKLYKPIINTIKGGTCLFIYGEDKSYLSQSKLINT
ncbi:MAG: murein L,D-transpeptidase catalytic domain family protein [Chitinophagaceae bacterium]|nr:murein L,D-transpeptidase catalytic domain family protein [Chitinophagaceae bacterium]